MRPAFSSTRQAAGFAMLLLVILLLPALLVKPWLPPRSEAYNEEYLGAGCFPFIHRQIFAEKGDLDIAFIGSSRIWTAVNTPYVQKKLSDELGRPANVVSLGWNWAGSDMVYLISRDLLARRHVRLLVITDEYRPGYPIPHAFTSYLFRYGEDGHDLDGLAWPTRAAYYAQALQGMPRMLLSLMRTNRPAHWPPPQGAWEQAYAASRTDGRLGSLSIPYGFGTEKMLNPNFVPFKPEHDVPPEAVRIYSAATKDDFNFAGPPTPPEQVFFLKKLADLAAASGTKLVWLHVPQAEDRHAQAVPEREGWPERLAGNIRLLGIPPESFLRGISREDSDKLFYNQWHLNQNGQEYFTRAITPALLKLYAP